MGADAPFFFNALSATLVFNHSGNLGLEKAMRET